MLSQSNLAPKITATFIRDIIRDTIHDRIRAYIRDTCAVLTSYFMSLHVVFCSWTPSVFRTPRAGYAALATSLRSRVTGGSPCIPTANVTRDPHSGQGFTNNPFSKIRTCVYGQTWHL